MKHCIQCLIYSCFEKGCLTNGEKLMRQCRKLLWVRCFNVVEGNSTKPYSVFHLEPQSSKAKLLLPIMPIGIVAYAFKLSWDNLCRNSCIWFLSTLREITNHMIQVASLSIIVYFIQKVVVCLILITESALVIKEKCPLSQPISVQ